MPQAPYTAARPAAELQPQQPSLEDALSCPRTVAVGHRHRIAAGLGQRRELSPRCLPLLFVHLQSSHIVRLYSMPLLAEMPDQGSRLQRRLWACRYILWGIEHGLRLASVDPMCCR